MCFLQKVDMWCLHIYGRFEKSELFVSYGRDLCISLSVELMLHTRVGVGSVGSSVYVDSSSR